MGFSHERARLDRSALILRYSIAILLAIGGAGGGNLNGFGVFTTMFCGQCLDPRCAVLRANMEAGSRGTSRSTHHAENTSGVLGAVRLKL